MINTNVISVILKSGATQLIVCLNEVEAQRIYLEIVEVMSAAVIGQVAPIIAIEDDATAVALNTLEIASLALGEHTSARIEQAPQKVRPRPVPVRQPERTERGVMIAN